MRPLAYLSHPWVGNATVESDQVSMATKFALEVHRIPVIPQWMFHGKADAKEKESRLSIRLQLVAMCDELWVCDRAVTDEMIEEFKHAEDLGKLVFLWRYCGREKRCSLILTSGGITEIQMRKGLER